MNPLRFLKLEAECVKLYLASRMAYRADFFISFVSMFLAHIASPLYVTVLYGATAGFGGWTLGEMLLLTGYVALGYGIASAFFMGVLWNTVEHVKEGTVDLLLLAPGNTLAYFINRSADVEDWGQMLGGVAVFAAGVVLADATTGQVLALLAYLPVPIAFFASLGVLGSAMSIRFIDTTRFYEFIEMFKQFSQYPTNIFPSALGVAFFTLLPVAVVGYAPVAVVEGKLPALTLISVVFVALFVTAVVWYWHRVLRHYTSAGG